MHTTADTATDSLATEESLAAAGSSGTSTKRRSHRWDALRQPRVAVPLVFLILLGLVTVAAPLIAPYSPTKLLGKPLIAPGSTYLLGTDDFGRDLLSRLIYAGRVSLGVSAGAVALAALVGVTLGLCAGYFRGIPEFLIMRGMDLILSFPTIVLAIAMVAFLGPSIRNLIIIIAVIYTPRFVRIVYGSTLTIGDAEFVHAARVIGASNPRILRTAILPNVMAPIFVQISLSLGFAILVESGLSFLGLGAQPPTPSWGNMISGARPFMELYPHLLIFPSIVIGVTILMLNTLGDGLRDALDPRLRGSR
ncbi:MAG TPA: ABC transporter permease [Thermomicrobiales bacterium]|nr:ABC transporter permease [Thermomicrobiales bacterium]